MCYLFFFFNDTATTEIYTLSLHDALPISRSSETWAPRSSRWSDRDAVTMPERGRRRTGARRARRSSRSTRSEEHTSELQSPCNLVCRLLLEKKKKLHRNGQHNRRGGHVRY